MLEYHALPRPGHESLYRHTWDPLHKRSISRHPVIGLKGLNLLNYNPGLESRTFASGTTLMRWAALRAGSKFLGVRALGSGRDGKNENGIEGWDTSFEIEVPADQRPANELEALKEGPLYSWAQLSPVDFAIRLGVVWLMFFVFLGGPVASASFEPTREPLRFALAGGAGALFAVAMVILRLYLGWSYVGNRLLSAVVPYEETGWYDGQLWVKPPEVLARDRLLGAYQVKPVMDRLKQTLLGAAALLATATLSLFLLAPPQESEAAVVFTPRRSSAQALAGDKKVEIRKDDLLNLPTEVMDDEELAAAAAAAAKGRPVYCTDRFYRALAGGQYCKWEDLRN